MLKLNEVLKASKGLYVDDSFAMLWGKQLGGWKIAELTGTLPLTFRSNGTALVNYRIFGTADGAGVETENLWCEVYNDISDSLRYIPIYVGEGSFTLSTTLPASDVGAANLFLMRGNVSAGASTTTNGVWFKRQRTVQSDGGYITIAYRHYDKTASPAEYKTMLNSGSKPLPYEPYGCKLPLTLTSGTESKDTDIYIGGGKLGAEEYVDYESGKIYRWADITGLSEPLCGIDMYTDSFDLSTGTLTRRIKKLVLTGEETWYFQSINSYGIANMYITITERFRTEIGLGSHLNRQTSLIADTTTNGFLLSSGNLIYFRTDATIASSPNELSSYLAAQYAAGTPVTVWYVLAEPETSTIPVPSGLTGTIDGYLIQDGTPTPEVPIYPTANGVKQADGTYTIESAYVNPTDPPLPLPAIETFKGTNTLDSTETLGEVTISGKIKEA